MIEHSPQNGNVNGIPEADTGQNGGQEVINEETADVVNQQQTDSSHECPNQHIPFYKGPTQEIRRWLTRISKPKTKRSQTYCDENLAKK
jgi:hypothetical protein